jgi:hypothetical protein
LQVEYGALENKIFELLADLPVEEIPTNAYNADNLQEAITCYLSYGEYDIDSLMAEISAAYNGQKGNEF